MLSPLAAADDVLEIVLTPDAKDKASIFIHLPAPEKRTGAAIVICPGGGYGGLTMGSEGHDTAKWFVEHGVAGIVLKYRLPGKPGHSHNTPLDDAHAAIKTVRAKAAEWNIDPRRVGILGYSAGGHLASTAGTHFDVQTRPDFVLAIYPVITMGEYTHGGSKKNLLGAQPDPELVKFYSAELNVTKETPPTFLAHAGDDRGVNAMNSVNFYSALLKANVPAELHVYERGDHGLKGGAGYGIGGATKSISSTWPDRAIEWMRQRGLLEARPPTK
ncbi:MAG TPA: alpha/beta hydrolase [Planctomycetota bacterium]|nr:alpha/beta hydrolase [Planctomycetota bacterium]